MKPNIINSSVIAVIIASIIIQGHCHGVSGERPRAIMALLLIILTIFADNFTEQYIDKITKHTDSKIIEMDQQAGKHKTDLSLEIIAAKDTSDEHTGCYTLISWL